MSGPTYIDRALETSTTTGTVSYTLAGAVTGHQTLAGVGNANTCFYSAWDVDASGTPSGGWETGIGTWATGGTLDRTTILTSSNANAAVSWLAGTRRIAVVLPASSLSVFCAVYATTSQSIPTAVGTPILFDAEIEDLMNMHSVTVNTSRITIIVPGIYSCAGTIRYLSNTTGIRDTQLIKNGIVFAESLSNAATNDTLVNVSGIARCVAGDYIELNAYHGAGIAINSSTAVAGQPCLQIARIA